MNYRYIAIEGNIGAGKTALSKRLAHTYSGDLLLESFANNSFLPKFYENPNRYAFPLETSFLTDRYQQITAKTQKPNLFKNLVIADYSFDRSLIFASVNLPKEEYQLFYKIFKALQPNLPQPDLLIFLYASTHRLLKNIEQRGRSYEKNISTDYLNQLTDRYFTFLEHKKTSLPILLLDITNADFTENEEQYEHICQLLNKGYPPGIHRTTIS